MPFGFEQNQFLENKQTKKYQQKVTDKYFLEVTARTDKTGRTIPISFIWEDQTIKIDKVLDFRQAISLKDGIPGFRYTCRSGTKQLYLFFTGQQWYLEL